MDSRKIIPNNSRLYSKTIGFSFSYYIILFLLFSFIGWAWEVGLCLILQQKFVNRGVLFGPWLPIYGTGGLFLYFLLYRLKKHPIVIFLLAVIICSALEYLAGYMLEQIWGVRWWDYSDYFMNLHGHICLLFSLAFGVGALLAIYVLVPFWEKCYEKMPPSVRKWLSYILLILFIADATYAAVAPNTGLGISG